LYACGRFSKKLEENDENPSSQSETFGYYSKFQVIKNGFDDCL
jgi:hypothetical protein